MFTRLSLVMRAVPISASDSMRIVKISSCRRTWLSTSKPRSASRPYMTVAWRSSSFTIWATTCLDRKSTRLNSSHSQISYAVFCLKKKKKMQIRLMLHHKSARVDSRPIHHQVGGLHLPSEDVSESRRQDNYETVEYVTRRHVSANVIGC